MHIAIEITDSRRRGGGGDVRQQAGDRQPGRIAFRHDAGETDPAARIETLESDYSQRAVPRASLKNGDQGP